MCRATIQKKEVKMYTRAKYYENFKSRFDMILKEYRAEVVGLPLYDEFVEEIRIKKRENDKTKLQSSYLLRLKALLNDIDKELKSKTDEYKNITAAGFNSPVNKSFAATEYQNALTIFQMKPDNIEFYIKDAAENGRFEFLFTLDKLFNNTKGIQQGYKIRFNNVMDAVKEQFGIVELSGRKTELEQMVTSVNDYYELLKEDYAKFEIQVNGIFRVTERMRDAGQREGESLQITSIMK